MAARRLICDFCNSPEVRWAYPTADFTMPMAGDQDWGSHGGWAACVHCAALIERGAQEHLAARIGKSFARKMGGTAKSHSREARSLVAKFFASRTDKPRVAVDPSNPIDPTREDEWGRMMQADGPELTIETERPPETHGDGRTFSEESLKQLNDAMFRWVGSRIQRRLDLGDGLPQKLKVTVNVELDDESEPGSYDDVWHLIDGGTRRA